ncbi:MAG: copper chaperone PCu(A)C [Chloroflexi bacterium]|nr:copper chaperone PCu(A)C [Chloroflexota bacterium]
MYSLTSRLSPAVLALTLAGILILLAALLLGTTRSHASSALARIGQTKTSQPANTTPPAAAGQSSASTVTLADEPAAGIAVQDAWARASLRGMPSAVYFVVHNNGAEADTLIGAASDVAEATEVHRSSMDNGVMRMGPAGPVTIPAGESVTLAPGGLHVMLIGLHDDLVEGTELTLTLQFEHAGSMTLTVPVRPMNATPMMQH